VRLEDALARYIVQIEADGRSPHTVEQYRRHILRLARWLREERRPSDVEEIDHETLAEFLVSPAARERSDGRTKSPISANALRTSIRTFFRFTCDAGYSPSNPARLVRRALCGSPPPRALSDEESGALLAALSQRTGPEARRDRALFVLMLGSGIRLGSALALNIDDVDLERGELQLRRTKGDVPTTLPLARTVCDHLRLYINGRTAGALFPGRNGAAMCARHVQRRLDLWRVRAGIRRHLKPHDLRHTFAIRLYHKTRDLLLVQQALRHRSITSTTVYAQSDDSRLREALAP
jgi:site-specific recombinase XerC